MKKADLERMAERYQAKADKAYMNYQETGTARYDREYRNYDDLAAALRVAAGASDANNQLISIRLDVASLADRAQKLIPKCKPGGSVRALLEDVVAVGSIYGLIRRG